MCVNLVFFALAYFWYCHGVALVVSVRGCVCGCLLPPSTYNASHAHLYGFQGQGQGQRDAEDAVGNRAAHAQALWSDPAALKKVLCAG